MRLTHEYPRYAYPPDFDPVTDLKARDAALDRIFPQEITLRADASVPGVNAALDALSACLSAGRAYDTDLLHFFTEDGENLAKKLVTTSICYHETLDGEGGFCAYPMFQSIRMHEGQDGTLNSVTIVTSAKARSVLGKIEPLSLAGKARLEVLKRLFEFKKWERRFGKQPSFHSYPRIAALKAFELLHPHERKLFVIFPVAILYDFFNIQGKRRTTEKIIRILEGAREKLWYDLPFTIRKISIVKGEEGRKRTWGILFYMPGRPVSLKKRKPSQNEATMKKRKKREPSFVGRPKTKKQREEQKQYCLELRKRGHRMLAQAYEKQWGLRS